MRSRHLSYSVAEGLGDPHYLPRNAITPSATALQTRTVVIEQPLWLGLGRLLRLCSGLTQQDDRCIPGRHIDCNLAPLQMDREVPPEIFRRT
jgi:hypothetical protein